MNFAELLNYPESDWLDFKTEWPSSGDLIFDILCMANSDAESDRYLILGYNEEKKEIVNTIKNRKSNDELATTLRSAKFNRLPNISLQTILIGTKELDVIVIRKTKYRPYFLTDNKKYDKKLIRSGVAYTRNGSVNTPIDSSATETQIADMWRERFGLTLSPRERLDVYVQDIDNWKCEGNQSTNSLVFYYKPFPEFTIEFSYPEGLQDYSNPMCHVGYTFAHSIGNSCDTQLRYKYHTTVLATETLCLCDKHNFRILSPHCAWVYYNVHDLTDIHVFVNDAMVSDRGEKIEEIDSMSRQSTTKDYRQVRFFYNTKNSFSYCVQEILKTKTSRDIYNIYTRYTYTDSSQEEGGENENIVCPNKIYLFDLTDDIADSLRREFNALQASKQHSTVKKRK